jgi:hypothetical protein
MGLVLCPNTALCQQVVRLAASLTTDDGRPLLRACHVSSSSPPPFDPPDIVVTTPGALTNLFNDRGYSYGSQWTAEGVAARAAFVVVDEADLLCQGGYAKDLTRLLDVSVCVCVGALLCVGAACAPEWGCWQSCPDRRNEPPCCRCNMAAVANPRWHTMPRSCPCCRRSRRVSAG